MMARRKALDVASLFINRHYPDCLFAIVGGSVGRGDTNDHSDLDIVILENSDSDGYRKVVKSYGWVIECFVITTTGFRELFDEGIRAANPTLQRIIADGIAIHCKDEGDYVIKEARSDLEDGPMPWSTYEKDRQRYRITDYLEDVRGAEPGWEMWFSANQLTILLCEFILRANNQWIGEGKYLFRALSSFAPLAAERLAEALELLYHKGDPSQLDRFTLEMLEPYGGTLMEGFEE